jgi:hypothetical protein
LNESAEPVVATNIVTAITSALIGTPYAAAGNTALIYVNVIHGRG